jgi:hypothetical protein
MNDNYPTIPAATQQHPKKNGNHPTAAAINKTIKI